MLQYRTEARERAVQQLHEPASAAGQSDADDTGVVHCGDATREVIAHGEGHHCDLIVMGKHGTLVTEELLLGSVTQRTLAESLNDVLAVVDEQVPMAPAARSNQG